MQRRALVVDDEKLTAALICEVLTAAGFEVCLAHTAAAASAAFEAFDPDVAVLDISLGRGPSGLDLAHLASRAYPGTALLLLSRYPDVRTAGVSPGDLPPECGFLCKADVVDTSVLLEAVEAVLRETSARQPDRTSATGPLAALTSTQLQVLRMVAQGYTTSEIARRRMCSTSAVEKVLGNVYQRLGIASDGAILPRVEAVRIYVAAAVLPERLDST